jgi:hypothetical protein
MQAIVWDKAFPELQAIVVYSTNYKAFSEMQAIVWNKAFPELRAIAMYSTRLALTCT